MTVAIYGKAGRFDDPARFSFAYGGKDRIHFPVPIKTYDQSISILQKAVGKARMGQQKNWKASKNCMALPWQSKKIVTCLQMYPGLFPMKNETPGSMEDEL